MHKVARFCFSREKVVFSCEKVVFRNEKIALKDVNFEQNNCAKSLKKSNTRFNAAS